MTNEGSIGTYRCAVCGEENEALVDPTAGSVQDYVEDCGICCRPNVLHVRIDGLTGAVSLETEFEG